MTLLLGSLMTLLFINVLFLYLIFLSCYGADFVSVVRTVMYCNNFQSFVLFFNMVFYCF